MATYADIADVTPRLGGRAVTASTSPTNTEAIEWLDEREGELLGNLDAVGVPTTYALGSRGANVIRGWVSNQVARQVAIAHAMRDGTATTEDQQALEREWRLFLRDLRLDPAGTAAMLSGAHAPSSAVGIGSHVTGLSETEKTPIFSMSKFHL